MNQNSALPILRIFAKYCTRPRETALAVLNLNFAMQSQKGQAFVTAVKHQYITIARVTKRTFLLGGAAIDIFLRRGGLENP